MTVPSRLLHLLALLQDLTTGAVSLSSGPVRMEVAATALEGYPNLPAPLLTLLQRCVFLAPLLEGETESSLLPSFRLAEDLDLFLDLDLPSTGPLAAIPKEGGGRVARLRLGPICFRVLEEPGTLESVGAGARHIAGRTLLRLDLGAPDLAGLPGVLGSVARWERPADLLLRPQDAPAQEACARAAQDLAARARESAVHLQIEGVGTLSAGRPLDPLAPWNVLAEGYRSLFRSRLGLCPFPFLMVRWPAEGPLRACPAPGGPIIEGAGGDPWNAASLKQLRGAFQEGSPPEACRRCSLLPRVRASLEVDSSGLPR